MVKMAEGERRDENVAVAIDRDKGSQAALKWAVDNLLIPGETLTLIHVRVKQTHAHNGTHPNKCGDEVKELFLPFRCFCTRKDIKCEDVVLEDVDAAKGIIEYVRENAIDILVLGASKMTLLKRFKAVDVTSSVMKGAPNFCTVYSISRGKISSVRSATSSPPPLCTIRPQLPGRSSNASSSKNSIPKAERRRHQLVQSTQDEIEIKYPYLRKGTYQASVTDSDLSIVSSDRPSMDWMLPTPRLSVSSEFEDNRCSFATSSCSSEKQSIDLGSTYSAFSSSSQESGRLSSLSIYRKEDVEGEMRRLKLELKYTMDMYNTACKEAIAAKKMTTELHKWNLEREQKLEEARLAKESAMAMAENEKAKSRAAMEALATANKTAEIEAQKRKQIETAALREVEDNNKAMHSLNECDKMYRKYTIEEIEEATENFSSSRKIGEGGYGPVFKGTLDYTHMAIKVVRPDAKQGRSQFQQEVDVLTSIRHPNMVLLLGACAEYGCLVYEYMANGSLEDRLLRRGNSPVLSWQLRFRIAAEIATSLNFLHQLKPEPLVHRDLKPANILLDQHMVSKISDVGLARLVPPSVNDIATQYRITSAAGTLCYIDPEYQQTGMLGTKSDIYSFGIMLLQILTAKPPMSLTSQVEKAIEERTFAEILDPAVPDWPLPETLILAKIGLQCASLSRKDRPNLGKDVLPEIKRLMDLAEESMHPSPKSSHDNSHIDNLSSIQVNASKKVL
ncbi:PREDICTED: U-box domain-containing protein 35-like isoform X1 [Camelina sativa]|uniref:RING-type E3 ubiquitin transferase n=1 Tax=Camelina sativa TaxID=90675 RepID=A0ABM1R0L2_CAMSA|nr:PREDICTED: U-box domain-containing protein 35-like isoform X1 [Camelina sativa]